MNGAPSEAGAASGVPDAAHKRVAASEEQVRFATEEREQALAEQRHRNRADGYATRLLRCKPLHAHRGRCYT